jgi:hypothetical protein
VNMLAEHQTGLNHHVEIEGEDGFVGIRYNFSMHKTHVLNRIWFTFCSMLTRRGTGSNGGVTHGSLSTKPVLV